MFSMSKLTLSYGLSCDGQKIVSSWLLTGLNYCREKRCLILTAIIVIIDRPSHGVQT